MTVLSRHRAWIAAGASVFLLILIHVFVAGGANLPVYWEDEAGYLGNAQVMAGVGSIPDLRGRPYYLGWSLLLVPLWWIFQDGQSVYIGAVVLSTICGIAVAVPLAVLARRFGLSWPWAVVAGSVIAVSPARALFSGFGLPENLLALLVAFTALFGVRFAAAPTLRNAICLGLFAAGAFATHGRVVPLVAATALWLLFSARRALVPAIAGLVALGAVSGGSFLLYRHITGLIYGTAGAREGVGIGRILHAEFVPTLMSGIGQVWYLVIAWLGLSVIGFVVVGRRFGREWRDRRPSVAVWTLLTVVGMSVITFTSISSSIARGSTRLDILSYGRYLDPVVAPIALIGLVMVIRVLSRRMTLIALFSAVGISALWWSIVWPNRKYEGTLWWAPVNVTGTLQFGFNYNHQFSFFPWLPGTLFVIAALVVVLFLRRRPTVLVAALALYFAASTVYAEARVMRPFFAPWNNAFTLRDELRTDPILSGVPVSFDMDQVSETGDIASKNAYQILLAPTTVLIFDSAETDPETQLVIARQDWPRADELGALKLADDEGLFSNALWVLPGEVQDDLIADGELTAPSH